MCSPTPLNTDRRRVSRWQVRSWIGTTSSTNPARIVRSYDTGVTLRQLFYRLVSAHIIPNTQNAYKGLSRYTARARREGWFPDLIDRNRAINRYRTFTSSGQAVDWLRAIYRRPRDENQEWSIYVGVEKSGIVEQLTDWFGDLGIPIVALGGYSSQSYVDEIVKDVERQDRPAVLIYAGDFDPSGEDIERDFLERADCFEENHRIALTPQQIIDYQLPPLPGKSTDSRAAAFTARHGQLMQVELDALDPNDLRALYERAIGDYWDDDTWQESYDREQRERRQINSGEIVLGLDEAKKVVRAFEGIDLTMHDERDAIRALERQIEESEEDDDDA
jgi:hypothetical protein